MLGFPLGLGFDTRTDLVLSVSVSPFVSRATVSVLLGLALQRC